VVTHSLTPSRNSESAVVNVAGLTRLALQEFCSNLPPFFSGDDRIYEEEEEEEPEPEQ